MEIGIPRATRARERRVALTPSGVKALGGVVERQMPRRAAVAVG
ncbi:MAG TPA: hypothetical protein VFE33_31215 [Thermoanaerobaculia bacterium]|nr:hypothetical protein [Thermoanaerobaculia bacterium]